jgi:transcription-repair coupling factor (superfamily II helicase)
VFMNLLRSVTQKPDKFVLKQHNNRLAMTVRRVNSIAEAVAVLKAL